MYPTQYGDVVKVIIPPTIYETVRALGYHHLGDLYTEDHRVKRERTRKERAPTRKGIPSLRVWLTRHDAVLAPLLRVPPPRWQTAPKDWIPGAESAGRKWSSRAEWPRPPGWKLCTTGDIQSR